MPAVTITHKLFSDASQVLSGKSRSSGTTSWEGEAHPFISLPDPSNPGKLLNYAFLFWNIVGETPVARTTQEIQIRITPTVRDVTATAWYVPQGSKKSGVWVYAFSSTQNEVLLQQPIELLNNAPYSGPIANPISTQTGDVVIRPTRQLQDSAGHQFQSWTLSGAATLASVNTIYTGFGGAISVPAIGTDRVNDIRIPARRSATIIANYVSQSSGIKPIGLDNKDKEALKLGPEELALLLERLMKIPPSFPGEPEPDPHPWLVAMFKATSSREQEWVMQRIEDHRKP